VMTQKVWNEVQFTFYNYRQLFVFLMCHKKAHGAKHCDKNSTPFRTPSYHLTLGLFPCSPDSSLSMVPGHHELAHVRRNGSENHGG
jgi:hypothetical protein